MIDELNERYDVAVIGGGPAGPNKRVDPRSLASALVVIDSGHPRNSPADGIPPPQPLERGRAEVRYSAAFSLAAAATSSRSR